MNYKRLFISCMVALAVSAVIFVVMNDFGITWDEPIYFAHAGRYVSWLKNPQLGKEHLFFQASTDDLHPPFRKLIGGLTHEILVNQLKVLDNTRGYRISSLLFVFPFILVYTYIAIGQFGYAIGIVTPFIFSTIPHVLFLTPLMTTDYALAVMWFTATITMVKSKKSIFLLTITGVLVGCMMLTKLYGFLIVIPIVGYWMWDYRKTFFLRDNLRDSICALWKLSFVFLVSIATYVMVWPWLWKSPFNNIYEYFRLQLGHSGVPVSIFGQTYIHAPWWYTPIMFFSTTPVYVLVFFIIGSLYIIKKGNKWDWIFFVNALFPLIFFSLPGVYRYDGVRLFLASFPFVCLVGARGMQYTVQIFHKKLQYFVLSILVLLWLGSVYFSVIRMHPWESSYYNEFVGGVYGAYQLGFESEFWGNAFFGVLPWMNANKKDMMCVYPLTAPFYYYQAMGQIESGVVFNADKGACKYMVVLMRQGMFDAEVKHMIKTEKPVYQLLLQGVPLVGIYDVERKKE